MTLKKKEIQILVVDDVQDTRELIKRNLQSRDCLIHTASDVPEALRILESSSFDLVITDIKMPKVSGLDLVRHVRENYRNTEIIIITGYPSIGGAVEAVKAGAEDYLVKPFTDEELHAAVKKALEKLHARLACSDESLGEEVENYGMIGESEPMQVVLRTIKKTAGIPATVLIMGESGTGKELVARAIHYNGPRAAAKFVPVNCGGIPEGLLESELFGHVKGAFTGATETRAGFFQIADGGTIFLDEISETTMAMQVKLLRVLQEKEVNMIGESRTRKVDVRIIAATNKELEGLVKKGVFREDLFFRLNVIMIPIPPLRKRGDDILLLTRYFASKYADEFGKPVMEFSDKALRTLCSYHWPGNVRELENVVQRLIVMSESEQIDVADLPSLMHFSALSGAGFNRTLAEIQAEYIRNVLQNVKGNKTRAAEVLGIDRKTLREKLKKYKIED